MPRVRRGFTRASIEKIRETIDTRAAIKELHAIGHDPKTPSGVRVKALSVLLDKTMPTLTEKDIHVHQETADPRAITRSLIALMGVDVVRERWPDAFKRFADADVIDVLPEQAQLEQGHNGETARLNDALS